MLTAMEKIQEQASTRTTYPFFIVYGTDDETTSMAGAEWLIQNAKNSKCVLLGFLLVPILPSCIFSP